jgi:hypothetical protein
MAATKTFAISTHWRAIFSTSFDQITALAKRLGAA